MHSHAIAWFFCRSKKRFFVNDKAEFQNVLAQSVEHLKALGFDARCSVLAADPESAQGRLVVKVRAGDLRFKWLEVLVLSPGARSDVAAPDQYASTPCGFFYNRAATSFQLTSDLLTSAEDAKLFTDCFNAPRD